MRLRVQSCAVHPHGGGERLTKHKAVVANDGSSPRGWGTGSSRAAWCAPVRFIPTGVGNGPGRLPGRGSIAVHPHGGGERTNPPHILHRVNGSSPRGWGTGHRLMAEPVGRRFIPTGVGNGMLCVSRMFLTAVHPHGGGERGNARHINAGHAGSSPRGWGTDHQRLPVPIYHRFIPTGVGNGLSEGRI